MPEVRIQKALADAGLASRRAADTIVAAGRVSIDGRPAAIGERVDPRRQAITVDGRPLPAPSPPVWVAVNKPAGVTSTTADRHAALTAPELVPPAFRDRAGRLYPVGRLDQDSEGLLILTNEGSWADRVLHPRYGVEREYAVGLRVPLRPTQLAELHRGVEMDEGRARFLDIRPATGPESARLDRQTELGPESWHWYRVVLGQGWRRQIRRMLAAVGSPVERLVRVRIGTLRLGEMSPGSWRELTKQEAGSLASGVGARGERKEDRSTKADRATGTDRPGKSGGASDGLVVSLDGPGSSGKSTVGAGAAERLGYRFCDTGLLYRALTWLALERGVDPDDDAGLVALVPEIELKADAAGRFTRVRVDGRDVTSRVHTERVDRQVSRVARHAGVRRALLPIQRAIGKAGRIIMAGRDIGTVVFPDADLKLYLDVSVEERARRRGEERGIAPDSPAATALKEELRRRDGLDSTRTTAPLRVPEGATVIRSDGNTLDETIGAVESAIRARARALGRSP